jgi:asparagine synthase (glutamine-hydrolysing)
MTGLLPDQIRLNTRRGYQAADISERLLAHTPEMDMTLERLSKSDQVKYYLDLDPMRAVWAKMQSGLDPDITILSNMILLRGVMAGLFLQSFDLVKSSDL